VLFVFKKSKKVSKIYWVGFGKKSIGSAISSFKTAGKMQELELFSSGGFPDSGELFIARERGAELVGSIGSRTAVASNDQIVKGIENGVRNANSDLQAVLVDAVSTIVSAIKSSNFSVTIGDETIGAANERYRNSRGVMLDGPAFANEY
jgi:hypothetical protein